MNIASQQAARGSQIIRQNRLQVVPERRLNRRAVLRFHFENIAQRPPAIRRRKHLPQDFEPRRLFCNCRFDCVMLVDGTPELLLQFGQLGFPRRQRGAGGFHRAPQVGQAAVERFEPLVESQALVF